MRPLTRPLTPLCSPSSRAEHEEDPPRSAGSYLGLCEKIPYLKALGVTAVQIMPVFEFDEFDGRKHPNTGDALSNYWGYSPMSFFALKAGYASKAGQQIRDFKEMVKRLHKAGIEVILDVVYNHTCEGNENGMTFSFRGLDNAIYYMLDKEGRYFNFSGCGNTLNCNHPVVRDLIIDSLTEMVAELHVDGFRAARNRAGGQANLRQPRSVRRYGTASVSLHQLHHLPRRLHAR